MAFASFPSKSTRFYIFSALSQAPPVVLRKRDIRIPETIANIHIVATTFAPSNGLGNESIKVIWRLLKKIEMHPADIAIDEDVAELEISMNDTQFTHV
ncbi:hypothetical protein L2E82_49140 [Cichorium intybus]|uniref:Uncharacterized protein n=2 Tax=Cichorium intybus TaxID=13427 RepID=A0ACB8Z047_CICIN|nr:hypothetical protein L2E82_49137 [Cichorium intybus]KAI3690927.1 hypothetical protein L2E82_49140 [Cichorium intybus]